MLRALFRPALVGTMFGIPIRVMPAVALLTLFVLSKLGAQPTPEGTFAPGAVPDPDINMLLGLGLFASLAVSLLVHELAHALMARRLGLRVIDIVIWPLGGMARMEGMSDRPNAEAKVSLAGPLANLALAGLLLLLPGQFCFWVAMLNLILGLGNLVPAFPMDGGRVLRAWLARSSPAADATRAAVAVAGWLCVPLLMLAFGHGSLFLGLLLCLYIWSVGKMEMVQTILRTGHAPTISTGEVFRRAWIGADRSGKDLNVENGHFTRRGSGVDDGSSSANLESFHGSLDEFFDKRK